MVQDGIAVDHVDRLETDPKSVNKALKQINVNKATGPDGISASLLRTCADELTPTSGPIFHSFLDSHTVKKAIITPVPKKPCPQKNNYFRPIALTSFMEELMVNKSKLDEDPQLHSYQFAYIQQRGTDDATNSIEHLVTKHLENLRAYARILLLDFSSAFNNLQPHVFLKTLKQMNVNLSNGITHF